MVAVRSAVVFSMTEKPGSTDAGRIIAGYLQKNGVDVDIINVSSADIPTLSIVNNYDIAVSVGGDGTVLTCVKILRKNAIPIIPVNLGTFGYITDTEADEFPDVFNSYIKGKSEVKERIMIEACVIRNGKTVYCDTALNDITVFSDSRSKLATVDLFINGTNAGSMRADGILVATPTGSTAYNLSAGGPVLDPEMKAFVINAICPFSMNCRPLVVDFSSTVGMSIPNQKASVSISFDGHDTFHLDGGDYVEVRNSIYKALFIENPARNPVSILRGKLGWAKSYTDGSVLTS